MTPQYFKGDETELKFDAAGEPILSALQLQKNNFLAGAYSTGPLGDMIFDEMRSPLANAIRKAVFRIAFNEIFEAFINVGTFEAYITVFQKIFGPTVDVEFTVPGPGQLNIDIVAEGLEISPMVARRIESGNYVFYPVVDDVGDNICFQTVLGFTTQYELEQMLFEMVPAGIYTEISLTV